MRPAAIDAQILQTLHARAIEASLARAEVRPLLLAGLSQGVIAAIPTASAPADQLRLDLDFLARAPIHEDVDPIAIWLTNALHQVRGRPVAAVFEDMLRTRRPPPRTVPMGLVPRHPLKFERSAEDCLSNTPHAELIRRCLFGLEWPLRARGWRPSGDASVQLAIVSVLACHRGMRVALQPIGDGRVRVSLSQGADGLNPTGSSGPSQLRILDEPAAVRQAIRDYFEGSSHT